MPLSRAVRSQQCDPAQKRKTAKHALKMTGANLAAGVCGERGFDTKYVALHLKHNSPLDADLPPSLYCEPLTFVVPSDAAGKAAAQSSHDTNILRTDRRQQKSAQKNVSWNENRTAEKHLCCFRFAGQSHPWIAVLYLALRNWVVIRLLSEMDPLNRNRCF